MDFVQLIKTNKWILISSLSVRSYALRLKTTNVRQSSPKAD